MEHLKGKCLDGFEFEIFAIDFLERFYNGKNIPLGVHKVFYDPTGKSKRTKVSRIFVYEDEIIKTNIKNYNLVYDYIYDYLLGEISYFDFKDYRL